ncbi:hypothetical protein NDU88_006307 [Pleurodeles waltl]|uniref:Uncharacterized protein n=1 Tax=Pleurodeles waltl TaxID=8319 RepID=A0AAV7SP84_PLEWA|nr:hypothetical protein NDU88_006307 [Pleurodeles waltl]
MIVYCEPRLPRFTPAPTLIPTHTTRNVLVRRDTAPALLSSISLLCPRTYSLMSLRYDGPLVWSIGSLAFLSRPWLSHSARGPAAPRKGAEATISLPGEDQQAGSGHMAPASAAIVSPDAAERCTFSPPHRSTSQSPLARVA